MYEAWHDHWQAYKGGRMSKLFYSNPDSNKAKYLLRLSSYNLGRLIRLISGHNKLNYFQSLLDNDISPLCRLCEEEDETFAHWVSECPVLRQDRTDIFKVATNEYLIIPNLWSVAEVLQFSMLNIISAVIDTGLSMRESEDSPTRIYPLEPD